MTNTKFVYFDLGNVILNFSHDLASQQMADVSGVPIEVVQQTVFDGGLQNQLETGLLTSQEFHEKFCQATGTRPDAQELFRANSDIFSLNISVTPLLAALSNSGFSIGILSNTCQMHWEHAISNFPPVNDFFKSNVLSYEVQSMKPDPVIYQAAVAAAGVSPEQIFFMDDKPENVAGALAVGIDAVLFRSAAQLAVDLNQRELGINF